MKPAKEFWKDKFGEYPQTDSEKLAVAMMVEYATEAVNTISARLQVLNAEKVKGDISFSCTCPKCCAYDWSYHAGIGKMKCGDCGHEA